MHKYYKKAGKHYFEGQNYGLDINANISLREEVKRAQRLYAISSNYFRHSVDANRMLVLRSNQWRKEHNRHGHFESRNQGLQNNRKRIPREKETLISPG